MCYSFEGEKNGDTRWVNVREIQPKSPGFAAVTFNDFTCNKKNFVIRTTGCRWSAGCCMCVPPQIKKTWTLWDYKRLPSRFTGIRWWNKDLIFIWRGSQSQAGWSGPSLPLTAHFQDHIPSAYLKQHLGGIFGLVRAFNPNLTESETWFFTAEGRLRKLHKRRSILGHILLWPAGSDWKSNQFPRAV